ncbi:MAG: hypothetical protein K2P57_03930 [Burkholderiales bacterium]|nr:hypothetical protein [Burkholderiales bacterium]
MKKHIVLDLSFHGFGHISQSAPVVNALVGRFPQIKVTIRSSAPGDILKARFACPFEQVHESFDFGIVMKNAIEVDAPATAARYAAFHRDWGKKVEREAARLASLSPDLVLSNVPYLSLAASIRAGVAAVAFCSLNWADLYRHYCSGFEGSETVLGEILDAYRSATAFLRIEPCMPMKGLDFAIKTGPVATAGRDRRDEIRTILGLRRDERIGLISMGGMPYSIPLEGWPGFEKMRWLVPGNVCHPNMTSFETLGMPFVDLVASSDIMVTKPGYGSFVEAAMAGVAVLYLSRGDWPEEPYLIEWLKEHDRCLEVSREQIETGAIGEAIESLFAMPEKPRAAAAGIDEAVDFLEAVLRAT